MKILVTGAAGFIGMHVARRLAGRGDTVTGVDNLNDYYDPALKQARLARLEGTPGFRFERLDLADRAATERLFADGGFERRTLEALEKCRREAEQLELRYSHPEEYGDGGEHP